MLKIISVPRSEIRCATILSKTHFLVKAILHSSILLFCMVGILELSPARAQQSKIDSMLNVIQITKEDTNKVKTLYEISNMFLNSDPSKSIIYAKKGIELSKNHTFRKGQSDCLRILGVANYFIGKYDSALVCFEERMDIARELGDSLGIASCCGNIGNIKFRQNHYLDAIKLFERANSIFNKYKKFDSLASGYLSIGNVYLSQSKYSETIYYFLEANKLYEAQKNLVGCCISLINLSAVYLSLKQYDNAVLNAQKAVKTAEETGILIRLQSAMIALANAYTEKKDFDNALDILNKAKSISDKTQVRIDQAHITQLYVIIFSGKKEFDKAIKYNNELFQLAYELNDKILIYASLQNSSTFYFEKRDYISALKYLRQAEAIVKEINYSDAMLDVLKGFALNYAYTNPEKVSTYFYKYTVLKDSIYSTQSAKAIAEMQTRYETEKKDKEILSLNLEAQKRKNTVWAITSGFGFLLVLSGSGFAIFRNRKKKEQAELQQQVTEHDVKALRAQMNPHFIFNCIHSIDSLLDEQKTQESKECLVKFSALTRSVLENSDRREIPLSEEVRILGLYMDLENTRFAVPFAYELNIATEIDGEVTFIPPLILQPFVENSIKHGFSKETGGHLKIDIHKNENSLICIIEDNGCGRNIGSNGKGLLGTKSKSMGLRLSEDRLKLISLRKHVDAYFEIEDLTDSNNNPAGTRVKLTLPFEQLI